MFYALPADGNVAMVNTDDACSLALDDVGSCPRSPDDLSSSDASSSGRRADVTGAVPPALLPAAAGVAVA